MTASEFHELKSLISLHAPSLLDLIISIATPKSSYKSTQQGFKCANEWCKLCQSLSAISPVCGLLHPSKKSMKLIKDMCSSDITKNPLAMACLQEEVPMLFELLITKSIKQELLHPILEELMEKAKAPFNKSTNSDSIITAEESDEMSYFPYLPKCRNRSIYPADTTGKEITCTKRSSRHPTLLPGVFTLFCEHGKMIELHIIICSLAQLSNPAVTQSPLYTGVTVSFIHSQCFLSRYMLWFSSVTCL